MQRYTTGLTTILNAKAATGAGSAMNVRDFKHIIVKLGTASNANLTVKCQGAVGETAPAWGSAQSVANHWDYTAMYDYEDAALIAGDTGFSCAGADDFRILMVNVDGLDWVNFNVTDWDDGSVTVIGRGYTNL